MFQISKFIVEKKILFFLLFLAAIIFSVISMQKVNVNYDLTKYLPGDSQTKIALDMMEKEFGLNGVANVVIEDISVEEAITLREEIKQIEGVLSASFEHNEEHYKNGDAYIKITLKEGDFSKLAEVTVYRITEKLKGYEIVLTGSSAHNVSQKENVQSEMKTILAISIPIIILILFLSANSYAEILVFGIVVGTSVLINKGTNIFLGEISYITDSIAIVLQLALAMDYSIILLHRFEEEKKNYPAGEAIIHALKNSITSISASSLTTIFGLVSIMFMKFTIGFDIGVVLAKSILCSLLCVFLLMPGVLLLFNRFIDQTKHRRFIPDLKFISKYVIKTRFIMPLIFIILIALAFTSQLKNTYLFRINNVEKNELIEQFGKTNTLAIIVPKGDQQAEKGLIAYIRENPNINSVTAIEELGIRDQLTVEEFALKIGLDSTSAYGIYSHYLNSNNQIITKVEMSQLVSFMIENHTLLGLTAEELQNITYISHLISVNHEEISYDLFASILGLEENKAQMIYSIYESSINQPTFEMVNVMTFMVEHASRLGISEEQLLQLTQLNNLIALKTIHITYQEFSSLLGITVEEANQVYTLYEMSLDEQKYGLVSLLSFMNMNQATLQLSETQIADIQSALLINGYKNVPLSEIEFAGIMGMELEDVTLLYSMYRAEYQIGDTHIEFIQMIDYLYQRQAQLNLSEEETVQLTSVYLNLHNAPLSVSEFASFLEIPNSQALGIYTLYATMNGYQVQSQETNSMLTFMLLHSQLLNLDEARIAQLQYLINVLNNAHLKHDMNSFATILNLQRSEVLPIYGAYALSTGYEVGTVELNLLLGFMLQEYSILGLSAEEVEQLSSVKRILIAEGQEFNASEISSLMQLSIEEAGLLFGVYTVKMNQPSFLLTDMIDYMLENGDTLGLSEEQKTELLMNRHLINDTIHQFESEEYARILFNINLNSDDEAALQLIRDLRKDLSRFYDEYYVLGDSANILDIKDSFNQDVLIVNLITIISIFIILAISFKSLIVPILLIIVIQGSIWINFSFSALANQPIIFIGYIMVSAIQMGATIDYAIVMTERYKGFRRQYPKLEAVKLAIQVSLPTLLTSGGILIVAGFSVGFISSITTISDLGTLIGRGALISCILVLFLLPQFLILFDRIVTQKSRIQNN